jgi:nucleoid-associated protein YgaU
MKRTTIFALLLAITGCVGTNPKKEETDIQSDDLEFVVDAIESDPSSSEFNVEAQKIAIKESPDDFADHTSMKITETPKEKEEEIVIASDIKEPKFEEFKNPEDVLAEMPDKDRMAHGLPHPKDVVKQKQIYHVQKGDTLMLIAHKIYGDYRKWKEIKELNKAKIKGKLSDDMELKYYIPTDAPDWKPEGLAYLVKTGDTLGTIAVDKYGTSKKWKFIYENNRPLIRDPNLIFAGFTIYYKPTRDLASKRR